MKIQLDYEIPPAISYLNDFDELLITFWGNDHFKANGIGVTEGTLISVPIIRPAN